MPVSAIVMAAPIVYTDTLTLDARVAGLRDRVSLGEALAMVSARRPSRWRFAVVVALIGGTASLLLFSLAESETGVAPLESAIAAPRPQGNPRLPPPPSAVCQ